MNTKDDYIVRQISLLHYTSILKKTHWTHRVHRPRWNIDTLHGACPYRNRLAVDSLFAISPEQLRVGIDIVKDIIKYERSVLKRKRNIKQLISIVVIIEILRSDLCH